MSYETLFDFIDKKMRMSHIYQPVMLMTLLSKGGKCHEREIASELLARDQSQIEYYTQITNNMVGRVSTTKKIRLSNDYLSPWMIGSGLFGCDP